MCSPRPGGSIHGKDTDKMGASISSLMATGSARHYFQEVGGVGSVLTRQNKSYPPSFPCIWPSPLSNYTSHHALPASSSLNPFYHVPKPTKIPLPTTLSPTSNAWPMRPSIMLSPQQIPHWPFPKDCPQPVIQVSPIWPMYLHMLLGLKGEIERTLAQTEKGWSPIPALSLAHWVA